MLDLQMIKMIYTSTCLNKVDLHESTTTYMKPRLKWKRIMHGGRRSGGAHVVGDVRKSEEGRRHGVRRREEVARGEGNGRVRGLVKKKTILALNAVVLGSGVWFKKKILAFGHHNIG